jgi:CDGSH-type Zn-finger protein
MGGAMRVIVKPKGTIVIEGEVVLCDPDGNEIVPPSTQRPGLVRLCGCGKSRARPFCDGSHKLDEG